MRQEYFAYLARRKFMFREFPSASAHAKMK